MDKITEGQLSEFSANNGLDSLKQSDQFEHYVSYVTIQSLYGETFDTDDVVLGADELGIDGIAIIVNGVLVSDFDDFKVIADAASSLDVTFIFIQADRSTSFAADKIGNIIFAVRDFFSDKPKLPRTSRLNDLANLASNIYAQSAKFKRSNPNCYLFYATTGQWNSEKALEARREGGISDLKSDNIFGAVHFNCIGANIMQRLYRQAKNAIARDFNFVQHAVAPEIPGIKEAYLGFIPANDFMKIIKADDGEIMRGIFEANLRDFQGTDNPVNTAIKATLESEHKARFVLMNNGVTVIARVLQRVSNKFHIEDFQIVNGCQTSNVLFNCSGDLDGVMVPLRLISSDDDDVIQSIVTATNQQTTLSREQLFAATEFPKKLEQYFQAFEAPRRLYYERRSRQYERLTLERLRIITQANAIRAFAGMYLEEPHRTTRNFNALLDNVGKTVFVEGHKLDPYYVSSYTLYKLEKAFKSQKISTKFKPARYQILLAARRIANPEQLPQMNSKDMEKHCKVISDILWDADSADKLIEKATKLVEDVTKSNLDRDHIRTVAITEAIKGYKVGSAKLG